MAKAWLFRSILTLGVLLTCLAMCEWALRHHPELLPRSYLDAAPFRRVLRFEINRRGILSRTPIEGVPIPYQQVNSEIVLPAPVDIVGSGLIPRDLVPADEREQELRLLTDRYGLLNANEPASVDVLLIGDSYTYLGGIADPPGFQIQLARETGLAILNLGVPSVGPTREAWMLAEIGLPREPRAVVWFFFGGNDLEDEAAYLNLKARGATTYADRFADVPQPKLLLLDVLMHFVSSDPGGAESPEGPRERLPGFHLKANPEGAEFWLLPKYVRSLTISGDEWRRHPGWQSTKDVLRSVASKLRQRGIAFLLVYVPSKAQTTLPYLAMDAPLLARTANYRASPPLSVPPAKLWLDALRNRAGMETLLGEFCREWEIEFLSLTPFLAEQASAGTLGYWSADSHWNFTGQSAAVPPLAKWLGSALSVRDASADTQE